MQKIINYFKTLFTRTDLTSVENNLRKDLQQIETVISNKRNEIKALTDSRNNINSQIDTSLNDINRAESIRISIKNLIGEGNENV